MKTNLTNISASSLKLAVVLAALNASVPFEVQAAPMGTAFTYQGKLNVGTNAANGVYDFSFALYDAASGGAQKGATFATNAVPVASGLFTVTLDFGSQFPGDARWLDISVKTNGAGSPTLLAPRQQLTPSPYSLFSSNAAAATTVPVGGVTGTLMPSQMPANLAYLNSNQTFSVQQAFAARVNFSNTVQFYTNAYMNDRDLQFRSDAFHGVGWYGAGKTFAGANVNGPVLYGGSGGALGANTGSVTNIALSWDGAANVSIPSLLSAGNVSVSGLARLNDHFLYLRGGSDAYHGLCWAGASSVFSNAPDGPVLFGCSGGSLGTMCTPMLALSWKSDGNVFTDPGALNNRSLVPGLTFGPNSGEGISSRRTAGAGQFSIDFYTANAIRMTIDNNGNVGIGQTSPSAKLDVNGTVKATSFSGQGVLNWVDVTGTSQQAQSNTGYIADNSSQVVITLPNSPAIGDVVRVTGGGAGGWRISQYPYQNIRVGSSITTVGTSGYLTGVQYSAVTLLYIGNFAFYSLQHEGSLTSH